MEAYTLFAKDLCSVSGVRRAGLWLGWINCLFFGIVFCVLSGWAVYGIFESNQKNEAQRWDLTTQEPVTELPESTGYYDRYQTSYPYYDPYPYYYNWNRYDALGSFTGRDWFCYFYLSYCLLMFFAGILFINGVKQSNFTRLVPFLVLSAAGIVISSCYLADIQSKNSIILMNGVTIPLLLVHIASFFWTLTRCLQLKYTPEKLSEVLTDSEDDIKRII